MSVLVAFKFLHIAAISIWAAGLVALPLLYSQRRGLEGGALHNLHAFTRQLYVAIVSPAAFIGVGTGIVLIFLRETFTLWFALKLGLVGVLVGLHLGSGLLILRLFRPEGQRYGAVRFLAGTAMTVVVAVAIVGIVLAKPRIELSPGTRDLLRPGELHSFATELIRRVRP